MEISELVIYPTVLCWSPNNQNSDSGITMTHSMLDYMKKAQNAPVV